MFGGSWGSTLSLVYAETYPARVLGLILRGIFLCRPEEIRWFYQSGAHWLFPDYWRDYIAPIPTAERHDLVSAYYRRLTSTDRGEQARCARAWSLWEARTSTLLPNTRLVDHFGAAETAVALARIECHYFMHDSFLEPDQILANAERLRDIPGMIIHGRYDAVCPLENAWSLHEAWPGARLQVIPNSGHSATEPATTAALVAATEEFAGRLG